MIKEEFQLKNLAFYDCKKEQLLFSQVKIVPLFTNFNCSFYLVTVLPLVMLTVAFI